MNALLQTCTLSVLALALAAGCNEEKHNAPAEDAGVLDSGPAKPVLGGKLGAAVAAAESAQAMPQSKGLGDLKGPPESGIFPPGGADLAQAANKPAKIELINEGSDPKVTLSFAPFTLGDAEQKVIITTGVRSGQQMAVPLLDFGLSLKVERPKGEADKDKTVGPMQVTAKIVSVGTGTERLPKDLSDALGKLKGSELKYKLSLEGAIFGLESTLSKGADPGLDVLLRALVESMTLFTVPLPQKPVGEGAYWMVTDRSAPFGVDVVRYRVFRVQKVEKDRATLAVDIRQYAATDDIDLSVLSKGMKVKADRFDSQGKAAIEWSSDKLFSAESDASERMLIQLGGPKGAPPKGLQLEIVAHIGEANKGEKKK